MRTPLLSEIAQSPEQTVRLGSETARLAKAKAIDFIALFGGMGAGKTAFTSGLAAELVPGAFVSSPTYAIVNEYYPENASSPPLFHFDMYRIEDADSLDSIGFYDYLARGGMIVTEWSENIVSELPERYLAVTIERISDSERKITVDLVEQ